MPDGLAAARSLGLDLEGAGVPFRGIRFCGGAGHSVEAGFPAGRGMGLRRTTLHEIMVDHAARAGVKMAWGVRVTGLGPRGVMADGRTVKARWIVGADGGHSAVRRWAGLDACARDSRRYAFRRHYRIAPWSEFMEIHWGAGCQLYITPVAASEICVVLISRNQRLRLDEALPQFPEVQRRLAAAPAATLERGGVSASRRLKAVYRGNVALAGDASGSVDAITGEGLCLLFQHAVALAEAFERNDLAYYQAGHRKAGKRPAMMADLMLLMDGRRRLRQRALQAMSANPRLFARMLALHVGVFSFKDLIANGLALGWQMLTV